MRKIKQSEGDSKGSTDSETYTARKAELASLLTIYGRKPVLEALQDATIQPAKLHLAESNKPAAILKDIERYATNKGAAIAYHDKKALSRISKNGKQDQGVALDIRCPGFMTLDDFLACAPKQFDLILLDAVTNPQNLGMIIRSVTASPAAAIVLPEKGCAKLDALVIKASAGTLFRANILRCNDIPTALERLKSLDTKCYALAGNGQESLGALTAERNAFVMGNESDGVSQTSLKLCDASISIPMARGVESLNVGVAASLVAFRKIFTV